MANEPDFTEISIRHKETGESRTVAKHAFDAGFWPEYEAEGRKAATPARTEKKD